MISLLLDWVSQPLGAAFTLLLLALVTLPWRRRTALPAIALAAATLGLWLAASPVPTNALLARLEIERSGPEASCAGASALPLVVPGGGMDAWRAADSAYELLHRDSLQRVARAADLAAPGTRFYLLGGGDNDRTLADLMARVLLDRGVPAADIVAERESRSTRENARALTGLLPPDKFPTIRLLTSALHLARASAVFERAGYRVCGIGVGSLIAPAAGVVGWMPWLSALERGTRAWRELLAGVLEKRRAAREEHGA